jgi:hypothetical protein
VSQELEVERNAKTTAQEELKQVRQTLNSVTQQKDQEIARLNQQVTDEAGKYTRNEQDVSKRLAAAQAQVTELDRTVRTIRDEKDQAARESEKERSNLVARMDALTSDLAIQKQPDLPDGEIITVSDKLPLAWIDIGANDRLARGTRFRIQSAGPRPIQKGWAQVTRLEPGTAEVELFDVDVYSPVVAGDVILNPVYARTGERHAVLAGRFSNPSVAELTALLARMGIVVQSEIDLETDYLIVGNAIYTDEDGEPLDEPLQPTELEVYRQAEGQGGINIVPLSRLRGYFVF